MARNQTGTLNSEECPQFFKLYMPDHCSTQLKIPPEFLNNFKGCLSSKFTVTTCSRKSWEVDVNKVDNDVFLKTGWETFVQDNLLEFGDFLIFYYNGESTFYVSIFGKNNCVKEIKGADYQQPMDVQVNEVNGTGEAESFSVKNSHLSFEVTIKRSYLTFEFLSMPKVFYDDVKEHNRAMAKLQHSGRTWDVKVVQSGEKIDFRHGFGLFAADNCLAVGDVCCFKVVEITPEFYVLDVSFSREL